MTRDDLVYVGHMLDTARKAVRRVVGKTRADFDADEDLRIVLTHLIQTIGEAARRVSPEVRTRHPEVPWNAIVGMRHRIVHDYINVDEDIVWEVASKRLEPLVDLLVRIMPQEDS